MQPYTDLKVQLGLIAPPTPSASPTPKATDEKIKKKKKRRVVKIIRRVRKTKPVDSALVAKKNT